MAPRTVIENSCVQSGVQPPPVCEGVIVAVPHVHSALRALDQEELGNAGGLHLHAISWQTTTDRAVVRIWILCHKRLLQSSRPGFNSGSPLLGAGLATPSPPGFGRLSHSGRLDGGRTPRKRRRRQSEHSCFGHHAALPFFQVPSSLLAARSS